MSESRSLRLFLAIEIPTEWRSLLSGIVGQMEGVAGNSVKWVRPELMHITLLFLGNQPEGRVPVVTEAMSAAAAVVRPFYLALGPAGYFGSPNRLRTLWVGLRDIPSGLAQLHDALVHELSLRGVPFDAKGLVPHVTLGRTRPTMDRETSRSLYAAIHDLRPLPATMTLVNEFRLVESRLSPSGPEYSAIRTARLGGADA